MSAISNIEPGMHVPVPPDFDPDLQLMYYLRKDGTVDHPFTFKTLDESSYLGSEWGVVYGVTIGAGIMTLLHVLALTPVTKRRTLIYWLNVVGLCQVWIRGIIQCLYFTRDRYQATYVVLSGDSTSVPNLHRIHSTMSVLLSISSIATVEAIFFVQGRAILSSLPRRMYLTLISVLVFFGVAAVLMRTVYAVYNFQDIWIIDSVARDATSIPRWAEPTSKSSSHFLTAISLR
jgi:hypothetical protein